LQNTVLAVGEHPGDCSPVEDRPKPGAPGSRPVLGANLDITAVGWHNLLAAHRRVAQTTPGWPLAVFEMSWVTMRNAAPEPGAYVASDHRVVSYRVAGPSTFPEGAHGWATRGSILNPGERQRARAPGAPDSALRARPLRAPLTPLTSRFVPVTTHTCAIPR
jgi:hypothetical protein